jgi:hypothetical protein
MIWFVVSILSFVWRTGDATDPAQPPPISAKLALIPRIGITAVFAIGLVYFFLIIKTLHRYGGSHGGTYGFFHPTEDKETADDNINKTYDAAERGEKPSRGAVVAEGKTERRGRERTRRSGSQGEKAAEGVEKRDAVVEADGSMVVGLGLTPGNMSNAHIMN